MKLDIYLQKASNLYAENRLLKFVIIILAAAVVFSSVFSYKALKYEKVVLIPPNVHSKIMIVGDKPNNEYIKQFSRYVVALALDYTSASARGQFDELLTMFTPGAYKKYKQVFYTLADQLETAANISNAFYIQKIKVTKKAVLVQGVEKTFIADTLDSQKVNTYRIGYMFKDGRFMITDFKKIEKYKG